MNTKTAKPDLFTQPGFLDSKPAPGRVVRVHTADTSAAASTPAKDDAEALDQAVAKLTLADDHHATMTRAPSLQAMQMPEPPRKIKSDALDAFQRARVAEALQHVPSPDHAARSLAVSHVREGARAPFKEPSVLEFVGSNGVKQRWFVSPALRQGSYGKFRVAVLDTPQGEAPVIRAIKEYRLDERQDTERANPSPTQRQTAIAQLREIATDYPSLANHARSLIADLKNEQPLSVAKYEQMIEYIDDHAEEAYRPIDGQTMAALQLKPKTSHITRALVEKENALYPLANSPLRVQESVELDGRVYNFSELMRGELFDVLAHEGLTRVERNVVSRATARDATARLLEMHDVGIIHRDIKLENIFMDEAGKAQLGDWGFATLLKHGKAVGAQGTMDYIAPEVLSGRSYSKPADIYSLGLTLALASSGTFLVDSEQTFLFTERGRQYSTQHEALALVLQKVRFDARGCVEPNSLNGMRTHFMMYPSALGDVHTKTEIARAAGQIAVRIAAWNKIDAQLCGTVLRHMLCRDPEARADAKALHGMFLQLQPEGCLASEHARELSCKILEKASDLAAEIAVVQAYGKNY